LTTNMLLILLICYVVIVEIALSFGKGYYGQQMLPRWATYGRWGMVRGLDSRRIAGLGVVHWPFSIGVYNLL
jgi:hypothetical protein